MAFTTNAQMMEQFCAKLNAMQHPSPTQTVLRDILVYVHKNTRSFDGNISTDSPFFQEFFEALRSCSTCEDNCFSMLECMIIFCREKALRFGAEQLSLMEHGILRHFEKSGMWEDPARETLVSQWYWTVLPKRYESAS